MGSNKKGSRAERELVNTLYARGFAVMRAPSSGAATERELPDVLAGNGSEFYAIEAKAWSGTSVYLDHREAVDLTFFANGFGAVPLVAGRPDITRGDPAYGDENKTGWYFRNVENLPMTEKGNRRLAKSELLDQGIPLRHLPGAGAGDVGES